MSMFDKIKSAQVFDRIAGDEAAAVAELRGGRTWSPQQQAIFQWFEKGKGNLVVRARAGTGKCLGAGTPVMLHSGKIVKVEDVKVGDKLMGPDSEARNVLSTNTGKGPMFRIVPTKGDEWTCNDVHMMTLKGTNHDIGRTIDIPLCDLLAQTQGSRPSRNWKLFRVPVNFPVQAVEVDPYLVGLWIGDGTADEACLTNSDPEILDYCQQISARYGSETILRRDDKHNTYNIRFRVGERGDAGPHTPSPLRRFFKKISEGGKYIPDEYIYNSENVRLELLAGWIDTDGTYNGNFSITTVSDKLAEQLVFLCRSLGFAAYCFKQTCGIKSTGFVGEYNRVQISGDIDRIPCKVARRKVSPRKQIKRVLVTGFAVEPIGEGEYFGFTLDGDGRFLLGDFTVTHNTTTILEGIKYAPETNILLCAFNKRIADELSAKLNNPRAQAKTLHGVGWGCISKYWKIRLDNDRGERLARMAYGEDDEDKRNRAPWELMKLVKDLAAKGKEIHPLDATEENLEALAIQFDIIPDDNLGRNFPLPTIASYALKAMRLSAETNDGTIEFPDMIYLPLINGWAHGKYDLVVADECQDLNQAQLLLAQRVLKRNGRIVVVGDDRQAIYGFRGADSGSLDRLKKEFEMTELGLNITYRCGKSIVHEAQEYVPDFQAAPTAPEGVVRNGHKMEMMKNAGPGDFILSRTNAPLAEIALMFMRAGIKCKIEGKDIGKGLQALIKRMRAGSIDDLFSKLSNWKKRECQRADQLERKSAIDARVQYVTDQHDTIVDLSDGVTNVNELLHRIEMLFADDSHGNNIVCSTVHKAKGLEANRVWLLDYTFCFTGEEESNIRYVAVSRAKQELVYIGSKEELVG